jgi:hypothetical protein
VIKALFFHAITMAYNMKEKEVLLSNRSSLDQPSPGLCSHLFLFIHSLHQSSLFYFIDWWIRRVNERKKRCKSKPGFPSFRLCRGSQMKEREGYQVIPYLISSLVFFFLFFPLKKTMRLLMQGSPVFSFNS